MVRGFINGGNPLEFLNYYRATICLFFLIAGHVTKKALTNVRGCQVGDGGQKVNGASQTKTNRDRDLRGG